MSIILYLQIFLGTIFKILFTGAVVLIPLLILNYKIQRRR